MQSSLGLGLLVGLAWTAVALGEVTRFEIRSREPFAEGQAFGEVGPYERIVGKVHFALDPGAPQNSGICDLSVAPRIATANGERVEFSSDLFLLAPRDLKKASGTLLYDVNNRGNKLALTFFNDAAGANDPRTVAQAGNGFLMRRGIVVAWSGWIGELLPGNHRLQLFAPVATGGERPITGRVRYELVPKQDATKLDVNGEHHGGYWPTPQGEASATLTWRLRPHDERVPIPRPQFKLHVADVSSAERGQLPRVQLELPAGFRKGSIYELIYEARDPLVHGVCFAGVRDLASALLHGEGRDNPLLVEGRPVVRQAIGFGVSQSGRFLRELMYWGFNTDERGRKVFAGLLPHVAGGGLGSFNHRFAQPTSYATQHEHHFGVSDRHPFAYAAMPDPFGSERRGVLHPTRLDGAMPLVMHTQSSAEYWTRSGSLVHTDPLGTADVEPPPNVRLYTFGGTQHGPAAFPPQRGDGQNLANPGDYKPLLRALLVALEAWCRDGVRPPESVVPRIAAGTLVDWRQSSTGFPAIPGVWYPQVIQSPPALDLGERFASHGLVERQPPRVRGQYRALVPKCDADGNDLGCIQPAEVAVPLATYTGWNVRRRDAGAENELVSLNGSYLPFAATKGERERLGDPRPSAEERYGTLEEYVARVERHCQALVGQRLMLAEDVPRVTARVRKQAAATFARIEGSGKR